MPAVLIHLHIHKTGGTTLNSIIKHGFRPCEIFESLDKGEELSGLDLDTHKSIAQMLSKFGLHRVRYISGHVPFGVHGLFGSDVKYVTVIRDPVERVISLFFFRAQGQEQSKIGAPFRENGRPISFADYIEGRRDVRLNNFQVRVLSGLQELDAPAHVTPGALISAAPVERRHLEQAKRNIDEHFLLAAPLERIVECALMLRRLYGWPLHRLHNEYKNKTKDRPRLIDIPPRLIEIIRECNAYDLELHEWIKGRFDEQRKAFEPELSRQLARYQTRNDLLVGMGKILPHGLRKRIAETLLYTRRD